jgi:choline dehydrogenase-like flavoprotein
LPTQDGQLMSQGDEHSLERLRVVDASAMPIVTSGNTKRPPS